MKIVFNEEIRSFSILHHYTTSDGAKSIMKEGFKNVNNQGGGISFFRRWDDVLRSDPRYNMHTVLENLHKRNERQKRNYWKRSNNWRDYWFGKQTVNPLSNYGYEFEEPVYGTQTAYQHGRVLSRGNIHDNEFNINSTNPDKMKSDEEIYKDHPDEFDKDEGLITTYKGRVTFPTGYKIANQIKGIGRGEKKITGPVYRTVVSDVGLPVKRWTPYSNGFGFRVEPENLDQATRRIEIPRGMYDGSKKLKRAYINDYKDFKPDDYSVVDQPTREAVKDIKKKIEFLGKGHGKKII